MSRQVCGPSCSITSLAILSSAGETHSVRSFVEAAVRRFGKEIFREGEGVDEVGRERRNNLALIQTDKRSFRAVYLLP